MLIFAMSCFVAEILLTWYKNEGISTIVVCKISIRSPIIHINVYSEMEHTIIMILGKPPFSATSMG